MRNKGLAVVCRFWGIHVGFFLLSVLVVGLVGFFLLAFFLFPLLEMAGSYGCYD